MASPPSTPVPEWTWVLDEAAIREDGGAPDMAVAVEVGVASQYAYVPPTLAYERALWEATRTTDGSSSPPVQLAASAGWILPHDNTTQPMFVAHTMLSAVWLLRQSLPGQAVAESVWAQLTQAASSVEFATTPTTSPPKPTRSSAKRARVVSDADTNTVASEERAGTVAVATVSNHNRQAERARKTRMAKAAERRLETLGLVEPGSQAPVVERNAHRSIPLQDEPMVAWIVKQPAGLHDFFHTAKLPYVTANTMLQCARAVGNETAKMHAAYFVHNWRRSGHPLIYSDVLVPWSGSAAPCERSAFNLTMEAITRSESVSATAGIVYRWGMAWLGQQYCNEIAQIEAADQAACQGSGHRKGNGQVRSRAKRAIWEKEKPVLSWAAYNARLKRSVRWFQAAQALGWGFLVLIPTATITPHWVEQTLRVAEWDIWLRLVERVNPAAVQASRDFDAWVGPLALQHGSIQGAERLQLESRLESRIDEVPDSDGDEEDTDESDSGDEAGRGISCETESRPRQPVSDHGATLRSLDLCELFRPAITGDSSRVTPGT